MCYIKYDKEKHFMEKQYMGMYNRVCMMTASFKNERCLCFDYR